MSETTTPPFAELLGKGDIKACCASLYESPAARWLVGDQLHPGGEALTLRTAELAGIGGGDRVLDIASGGGSSARLLAREIGCEVVGVDHSAESIARATAAAAEAGLDKRLSFIRGDAESLPLEDASFDALLCECSLCTFPDKSAAAAQMRRVVGPEGTVAISDVTAQLDRLPPPLRGAAATVACVGDALTASGYERLLAGAGLELVAAENHDAELRRIIEKVEARLRVAGMVGSAGVGAWRAGLDAAVELAGLARLAVADGYLGYSIFIARPATP